MLVIPAIDLKGGKCVRLRQGDMSAATVYSDDPVETAFAHGLFYKTLYAFLQVWRNSFSAKNP